MTLSHQARTPTLGLSLIGASLDPVQLRELGQLAESLGYDSIWSMEAWGSDAYTPLAFLAAATTKIHLGTGIAHIFSRTPGATAMSALTLQQLSGGRLLLGLGVSGPQVVEGWHGVAFQRPLAATREYLTVLRKMLAGDSKVEFRGDIYSVPYSGADGSGLGRPLRTTQPPAPDTPILIAALGPKNTKVAVEHADGLLPYLWSPRHWEKAWGDVLASAKPDFRVAPTVATALGDDLAACRDKVRPKIALHVGGMGSKDQNFYKSLIERYGYEEEAQVIQDKFLGGDRAGAIAAVSDELVDDLALVGPPSHVAEQLSLWRSCPISTLIVEPTGRASIEQIAELWAS